MAPELSARVAAYRGGYLPEERRALETALRTGELTGLAATNALELGIDVSGLDAVLVAGYGDAQPSGNRSAGPGARLRTRWGCLVARDDPLDTYLVHHPEALFGKPVEATVFDPANEYVLGPHLCAAAQEDPAHRGRPSALRPHRPGFHPSPPHQRRAPLQRRARGWYWTDRAALPQNLADIRSAGGSPVQLSTQESGRVVGTVDGGRAHSTAHPGAIYLHRGETWQVLALDLDDGVALITTRRGRLLDDCPRDHGDRDPGRAGARHAAGAAQPGHRRGHPADRVLPAPPPARRRGARRRPLDLPPRTAVRLRNTGG
ncbi:MAG: hypothetical protein R2734_04170 [Nocardioides sp.]